MSGSGISTVNTALTGMAAAQRAMDATSQNIVNANTPGYSRQRVLLESAGPAGVASFHSGDGTIVGGVRVTEVSRIHDTFLEATRSAAGAKQSSIGAQLDTLNGAQQLLAEPGETGVQNTMDSFYASWHDLANNPTDTASAAVVIQRGVALADQLHSVSLGIGSQWMTAQQNLANLVVETNQALSDLAKLNQAIEEGTNAQQPVNELMDNRDTLIRKLAGLVGASASTDAEGTLSLNINGVTVVNGNHAQSLTLSGATTLSTQAGNPPALSVGNYQVPVQSGSVAGLLAALRTDLPALSAKVDSTATSLVTAVNSIYSSGYTQSGSTGNQFFTGTNAQDLAVVPTTGSQLAIAAAPHTVDGSVALKVGDLADDATAAAVLGRAGPSVQWREMTSSLGVQVQSLTNAKSVQDSVVNAAEDAVQADAGVNLDEEMTNLMLFQRAYQASARVITTADELLDTLINRTGKVGL